MRAGLRPETSSLLGRTSPCWMELDPGVALWRGLALGPGHRLAMRPAGFSPKSPRQLWLRPAGRPGSDTWAALLTALAGSTVLGGALVQDLLLPVVVLIGFSVSARTGTDATLEGPAAQHLSAVRGTASTVSFGPPEPCPPFSASSGCNGPLGQD